MIILINLAPWFYYIDRKFANSLSIRKKSRLKVAKVVCKIIYKKRTFLGL